MHVFVLPYHEKAILIGEAYKASKEAFRGKKRKRGERYFEHCRAVPLILMDFVGVRDWQSIIAALMHDAIEDCGWTKERLASEFGEEVAFIVDGVSMPEGDFPNREARMEAYHQKFLAAAEKDVRVILVKLADRLHNLITCDALSDENQLRMVEETETIYLPLAKKHGVLWREHGQVLRMRRKTLGVNRKNTRR